MYIEPRFLLDEDSICYACPEYKHVSETCIQIHGFVRVFDRGVDVWEWNR